MQVKRGFVEIADGEVHYREAGQRNGRLPFVMLHPGPTSSRVLVPLMEHLGEARWIVAQMTDLLVQISAQVNRALA